MNISKLLIVLCISAISVNQMATARVVKKSRAATEQALVNEQIMAQAKTFEQQGEFNRAIDIYNTEIMRGSLPAMDALGLLYMYGRGVEKNHAKALELFQKAANKGYVPAQDKLGTMYLLGYGTEQSYHKAMQWFKKAALKGHAEAQYNYGVGYLTGQGLRQNKKQAKIWFGKSCDNGHQKGCNAYKTLNSQEF